jgi:Cu(I)/Ag(I) efflux system membrane fusion protein
MLEAKNENIEVKRIYFRQVSDAVYAISAAAKLSNAGVYRQYCPMAFNDEGAYWLSNSRDIQNPYFGRKMKECGEVTDSL